MITFPLQFIGIICNYKFFPFYVLNISFSPSFQEGEIYREGISIYLSQQTFITMSRKVSVYIYQYPEDANRTMSLRRFMDLSEDLIWCDHFFSSNDLRDLIAMYRRKINDYAALIGEPRVYRIVVRDSDSRLIASFRV